MGQTGGSHTSATLLARLRHLPPDQTAWGEFTERYGPKIFAWCRKWNLQQADAEDVTQTVLLKLAEKMQTFVYDPSQSFRAWLKTVTRHAWSDFWNTRGKAMAAGGTQAIQILHAVEAREDLVQRLEGEFDRELLEAAVDRVRMRVTPRTWQAYEMTAVEGRSGAEAAQALGMKVATVFVAKSKVLKFLQEERQKLEDPA
jgi:RNA polymerase sigma-70 factor (ECF subfamily)